MVRYVDPPRCSQLTVTRVSDWRSLQSHLVGNPLTVNTGLHLARVDILLVFSLQVVSIPIHTWASVRSKGTKF